MESNQDFGSLLSTTPSGSTPAQSGGEFGSLLNVQPQPIKTYRQPAAAAATEPVDDATIGSVADREGLTPTQRRVMAALLAQESGSGRNTATSTDGARGAGQILPATFARYARPGESIDNTDHNLAVMARIVKDLGSKFGDDPAKIATGYFSGEGNVGKDTAWKNDRADGTGKRVSSYVQDVMTRLGGIGEAKAATPESQLPDLAKIPKWGEIAAGKKFQALSGDEQIKVKGQYFDEVIAPHAKAAGANVDAERQKFLAKDAPPTQAELNAASKPAFVAPKQRFTRQEKRESVLEGQDMTPPDLPTTSRVPVKPEMRQAFNAKWDASTAAERDELAQRPDWVGMLARERAGVFERYDQGREVPGVGRMPSVAGKFDTRAEARTARLISEGVDPRFAEAPARMGAAAGVTPGKEMAYLERRTGTIGESDFDFETQAMFDPNRASNGLNNALTRGLAKGGLGIGKTIAGIAQFEAEVLGMSDSVVARTKNAGKWLRGKEDAIGERGDMLTRNLEGAINSVAQQLPLMIGGVTMASQAIPLAGIGMLTFGQEYSDGRARGQSVGDATTRAGVFAAFEVIGEKFGLGETLKAYKAAAQGLPADQIAGFLWAALKKEVPGELLTTTGQFATDKFGPGGVALNPNATGADYLKQVGDTIVQTLMQSGITAGGTTGVSKAVQFLNAPKLPEDEFARALQQDIDSKAFTREGINEQVVRSMNPDGTLYMPTQRQDYSRPTVQPAEAAGAPAVNQPAAASAQPSTNPNAVSDDDVLALAESRLEMLRDKLAGDDDADQPTGSLNPVEQQELDQLEAAGGDVAKLRQIYGLDQPSTGNTNETQPQNQATGTAQRPGAGNENGLSSGPADLGGNQPGTSTNGTEVGAQAGQRYEGLPAEDAVSESEADREARLEREAIQAESAPVEQQDNGIDPPFFDNEFQQEQTDNVPELEELGAQEGQAQGLQDALAVSGIRLSNAQAAERKGGGMGLAGELGPETQRSLIAMRDNPNVPTVEVVQTYANGNKAYGNEPDFIDIGNGFKVRGFKKDGNVHQEIKLPNGMILTRVLQADGTVYGQAEGDYDQIVLGQGFSEAERLVNEYFSGRNTNGTEQAPQLPRPKTEREAKAQREQKQPEPAFTRKEIPAMSDEELVAAQQYYADRGHKRASKIENEIKKRAQAKQEANGTQAPQAQQAEAQQQEAPAAEVDSEKDKKKKFAISTQQSGGLSDQAQERRQKLLQDYEKLTGSTRKNAIDYLLDDLQARLRVAQDPPYYIHPRDKQRNIDELNQQIGDLQAIRDEAIRRDERDLMDSMTRGLLQGAKDELDAALAAGQITESDAQDLVDSARLTGSAESASDKILDALDALDGRDPGAKPQNRIEGPKPKTEREAKFQRALDDEHEHGVSTGNGSVVRSKQDLESDYGPLTDEQVSQLQSAYQEGVKASNEIEGEDGASQPASKPKTEREAKELKQGQVQQPAPTGGTPEAGAGASQPPQAASALDAELQDALAHLGDVLSDVFQPKAGIMPNQYGAGDLLPALSKVVELLVRKGFKKFSEATAQAAKAMRGHEKTAQFVDQISPRQWKAAYNAVAEFHEGTDTEEDVAAISTDDVKAMVSGQKVEENSTASQGTEPVAEVADLYTPEGKFKVAQTLADDFLGGASFATIIEARKRIGELIGGKKIEPGTELAKQADETVEVAVVLAGREIVQAGRKQGRSPQVIFDRLLDLYNRQPNLAVRSSTSVRDQAYSTPVPLAYVASELAGVTYDTKLVESTAGNGMLAIGADIANTTVNELNPKRAAMLKAMGFNPTTQNAATETIAPAKSKDAVVINPPFGITKDANGETIIYEVSPSYGTREVDHAIVFKTLEALKDNGRAVLIIGGSNATTEEGRRDDYRGKAKRTFAFNLYGKYNVVDHFTVDGSMYSKQGASYPVDVIVIEGRGKSQRDLPAADLPKIITSYDELKEKLNGTRSLGTEGDVRTDRTDSGQDQAGQGDGEGLGGSTVGSGTGTGGQGSRQPAGGVRSSGGSGTGSRGGSRTGTGAAQPQPADSVQSGDAGTVPVPGDSGRADTGSQERNESQPDGMGGTSVVNGERVESGLTDRRGEEQETEGQVAYTPHSSAASVGTLVPAAMRDAIEASLQKMEDQFGNLDDYVAERLNMDPETVRTNFSAEQVDALALAIKNAEEGRGFIIGDQTGIGKGRVVAAMIRYALVNDKVPIFVTEKPNLYADMIRDLDDIGMTDELALDTKKPRILITNSSESIPYSILRTVNGEPVETSLTLKSPKSGDAMNKLMREMMAGESLGEYKVIFTTYSQLQTVKGKVTDRMNFVKQFGAGNYMIFDESHNAGGAGESQARTKEQREKAKNGESLVEGRAAYVRQLVTSAYGTFFSSATYAKRPDVMDLYSSTNMKLAVDRLSQLGEAIKSGGVPMQQVVANMLTTDGQYIRRERTFAGVSYDTVETKVDKQTAENMASAMRAVLAFSRAKEKVITAIQKEMDKEGAMVREAGGSKASIEGANFGAIMHNLIDQMLLSLKAQDSVRHAVDRLKGGEKVVLTVSNTMGSFLQDYAEEMGLNVGDPVSLSFADLYQRYLEKQRWVTIKDGNGTKTKRRLSDAELGPGLVKMFNDIAEQIRSSGFGSAPISPIDYLHNELRKAGYKTDEITGRTRTLSYDSLTTSEARKETVFSFKTEEAGISPAEVTEWYGAYARAKPYQLQTPGYEVGKVVRVGTGDDNNPWERAVVVGRVKESEEKSGNLYMAVKLERTGDVRIEVVPSVRPTGDSQSLDKDYQRELDSFRPARAAQSVAAPKLTSRSADIKQRVNAVRGFNNGSVDVLILNQAGSTGLSLHASSKFKDQRKRHMIIVQAEKNIDTHMQMLGRVHRTGQIIAPAYSQMMADVPAEMRPAAVLLKKMASLNANTTASRKSSVTAEGVVDFMNDYGGQVVHEFLRDNPEVQEAIGGNKVIKLTDDAADATEDDIRKFTGYVPILPIKQQEEIYRDLIDRYNELLERENNMGTNKLEAKAVDLDAETLSTRKITEDKGDPSIFASPANMEQVNVKRTVKPFTSKEVIDMVVERQGGNSAYEITMQQLADLKGRFDKFQQERIAKLSAEKDADPVKIETQSNLLKLIYANTKTILENYHIGQSISIADKTGQIVYGVITDIKPAKRTANPASGSDWKVSIALANGDAKSLSLTFSQIGSKYNLKQESQVNWYNGETQQAEMMSVLSIFDKGATSRREKRWIVTGNILAGYARYPGQIITFTRKDGTTAQGVLMSRQFDFEKEQKNQPVRLKTANDAVRMIDQYGATVGTQDGIFRVSKQRNTYVITLPSAKKLYSSYTNDKQLSAITGDFYGKSGSPMVAKMYYGDDVGKALEYVMQVRQEPIVALTHADKAREMYAEQNGQRFADLRATPSYAAASKPEFTRVNARDKLNKLEKKLEAGTITESEYVMAVREVTRAMNDQAEERDERAATAGRRRGADWIVAQLMRGVADNMVPRHQAEFAKWLLDQNPNLANDLGYSITSKNGNGARGEYSPIARVIRLFAGNLDENGETAVHEILHHTERMMPGEVQKAVLREWQRAWDAAFKKAEPKLKAAMQDMLKAAFGDKKAGDRVAQAFADGTLDYDQHYQLYSPSEFWAVNATRILSGRYKASGSWVKRAVQWFKEFVQRVKGLLGLRSEAPIIKAMNSLMKGEGAFVSREMLVNQDYAQWLAEKEVEQKENDAPVRDIIGSVQRNVTQFFGNRQNLRTFGAYDRSLSTQFNKALKDEHYGKVFAFVNAMQNEVSLTSIRPAELAPGILRKVDDFKSAIKTLAVGADKNKSMAGATNALIAGTLAGDNVLEGKVWTEEELRNNFQLDDAGVALYQQARAAIDASLDEVAAAEAYAMAQGFVPKQSRRLIIDKPESANRVIFGAIRQARKLLETALENARNQQASPERIAYLEGTIQGYNDTEERVAAIFAKARDLKNAGYMPLMRFGKFHVGVEQVDTQGKVIRGEDGSPATLSYQMFETMAEAAEAKRQLEMQYAGQDVRVYAGPHSNESHKLYSGISPETLALFAEEVGADKVLKELYKNALSERSALKRRLERKAVAGYSQDLPRILSNFITSNGRFAAQRYYMRDLNNAIKYIPKRTKGDVLDEAIKLREHIMNPNDPAAPVSAVMFAWFLGGSVASAVINLSQPILMTGPYLTQFGAGTASKALAKALPMALARKQIADADLRKALKRASQEGIVEAQEIFHLYSQGAQGVSAQLANALSKIPFAGDRLKDGTEGVRARSEAFFTLWGMMFSAAESFNRKLTFLAAWDVAMQTRNPNPYAFAVRAVNETQGIYNKANRPNWARGPVGRTVLTFKQFSLMYVELLKRMWKAGPEGKRAAMVMLGMLMLAAGEEGLPFAQDLDDLIDTIGQWMGFDTNVKRTKRRLAYDMLGETLGDLFLYGVSSALPLDFSGRLGLGNLIPGTGLLKKSSEGNKLREVTEVVGPSGSLIQQINDAYEAASEGNLRKAFENAAPKAVKDAMAGAKMATTGYATDTVGRKNMDVTLADAAVKAVGFNPTKLAEASRARAPIMQDRAIQKATESSIVDTWARGVALQDEGLMADAQKKLESWNEKNPDSPVQISSDQIREKARQYLTDQNTRIIKSTPREVRGRAGLDLAK